MDIGFGTMTQKEWLYRIQPARLDMLESGPTPDEEALINQHFEYLKKLKEQGTVQLAGRTLNIDESSFGIVIYTAENEADARKIFEEDPAVKAGVFNGSYHPFATALKSR